MRCDDELKEAFLRWVESENLPSGRGLFADDLPDATPVIPPEKPSKRRQASRQSRSNQRANCNGRRPLCFLQRNHRSRIPLRRRGRKAPRANPRRLSRRRSGCLVAGPPPLHPDVFHADCRPQGRYYPGAMVPRFIPPCLPSAADALKVSRCSLAPLSVIVRQQFAEFIVRLDLLHQT
jgi:hypothetical protein